MKLLRTRYSLRSHPPGTYTSGETARQHLSNRYRSTRLVHVAAFPNKPPLLRHPPCHKFEVGYPVGPLRCTAEDDQDHGVACCDEGLGVLDTVTHRANRAFLRFLFGSLGEGGNEQRTSNAGGHNMFCWEDETLALSLLE